MSNRRNHFDEPAFDAAGTLSFEELRRTLDELTQQLRAPLEKQARAKVDSPVKRPTLAEELEQLRNEVKRQQNAGDKFNTFSERKRAERDMQNALRRFGLADERQARARDDRSQSHDPFPFYNANSATISDYSRLEERLDEISRAIAASSNPYAPSVSEQHFDRIEARLASLNKTVADALRQDSTTFLAGQFTALARSVEALAVQMDRPNPDVVRLSQRLDTVVERFERSNMLSDMTTLLQGLENRLLKQFEDQTDAKANQQLLHSLERQLSEITARLGQPENVSYDMSGIETRLDHVVQALSSRNEAQEIARQIASEIMEAHAKATPQQHDQSVDTETLSRLISDLQALDAMARKSDARNMRTFEAIHEALLTIGEKLDEVQGGNYWNNPADDLDAHDTGLSFADKDSWGDSAWVEKTSEHADNETYTLDAAQLDVIAAARRAAGMADAIKTEQHEEPASSASRFGGIFKRRA